MIETAQPPSTQTSERRNFLGAERIDNPVEPVVMDNESFLALVHKLSAKNKRSFDDQAVVLLNTLLTGNPSLHIALNPREASRDWVRRFYEIKDPETGEFVEFRHGPVTDRLHFGTEVRSNQPKPVVVDREDFLEAAGLYAGEETPNPQESGYRLLHDLLDKHPEVIVMLPKTAELAPLIDRFTSDCTNEDGSLPEGSPAKRLVLYEDLPDSPVSVSSQSYEHAA